MKIKIQAIIEMDSQNITEDIACLERQELSSETLGLTLEEAKSINFEIQKKMINYQAKDFFFKHRFCQCCGEKLTIQGYHRLMYRTLFGKICINAKDC